MKKIKPSMLTILVVFIIAILTIAYFVVLMVYCKPGEQAVPYSTSNTETAGISDKVADLELDTSGTVPVQDSSNDMCDKIVKEYNAAVEKTKALKVFNSSIYATINQTSEDQGFNIQTSQLVGMTVDATVEGKEEIGMDMTASTGDEVEDSKLYYKDGVVYTEQGEYKIKTPDQTYAALNPREMEVINTLSFDVDAVQEVRMQEKGDSTIYVFDLEPTKVDFSSSAGVDASQLSKLVVAVELRGGLVDKSQFSYVVNTDTATIRESNKEALAQAGEDTTSISSGDSKPVTFEYTVKTGYTDIGTAKVVYPDFSEYKTVGEIQAERTSEVVEATSVGE